MKTKRSLNLIANFQNGYAKDWFFAVGTCFRDQLDIMYTERKQNKKTVMNWTQGPFYSFDEGHIFYDTPEGYLQWSEALKKINIACEVISGTPNINDEENGFINGQVHFQLSRPNNIKTKLEAYSSYHLSQNDFVEFLKTGKVNEHLV